MERFDMMLEPVRVFLTQVGDLLPRLLLALLVLAAGYFIARAVKFLVVKALRAGNFHVLSDRAGIDGFLRGGGLGAHPTEILGLPFYLVAALAALGGGFNRPGLHPN